EFLSSDESVHSVDGRYACLDELAGVFSGERVDGAAVYVEIIIRDDSWAAVCWSAAAVEDPSEHVLRDWEFDCFPGETDSCCGNVEAGCSFEDLDYCYAAADF